MSKKQLIRIILYFVLICAANYVYPPSRHFMQGILLILFWGTWFQNNNDWKFAQENGRYFNWFGAIAILIACYNLVA